MTLSLGAFRHRTTMTAPHDTRRTARPTPDTLARVTVVTGLLLLVDVLLPRDWALHSVAADVVPAPAGAAARAVGLVGGVFLLRLARGLRQRRHVAWRLVTGTCVLVLLSEILRRDVRVATTLLVAALLIGLLVRRADYTAGAGARGRRIAFRILWQGLVFTFGYGMLLLLLPGRVPGHVGIGARAGEVVASAVGLGGSIPINGDYYADLVHATVLLSALATIALAVAVALRPAAEPVGLDGSDEQRLRTLLAEQGARDSLGYFALRRDKSVVWSPSGKAAVTFRVLDGVALISGDPLGDPDAWPGALSEFRAMVEREGWVPAAMGSSELGASVLRRECGMRALTLGDEAIIDVAAFSLSGRSMRDTRQACSRLRRAGYEVVIRRSSDVPADELRELAAAAERWRTDSVERGFSMALSRFGETIDDRCVIVTARQGDEVRGLLHFVPWGTDGLSLDLMRRDRNADNGLNELMIAELALGCAALGVTRISLNFAMFRDALARGERIGAGPIVRSWRWVLLVASRWYQIESLYRFNDKFGPQWHPRFFCYPRARDVPRIALASLEAEAFVVRPTLLARLSGHRG